MDFFECKHGPEYWRKRNKKLNEGSIDKPRIPCLFPALSARKFVSHMKSEPVNVTMRFLGIREEEDLTAPMSRIRRKHLQKMYKARSKVVVYQQPCGLYSHIVFSKVIRPRDHIAFRSLRHEGHPFSLTIYVDSFDVTRVSQCCEYRRQCGEHIGGSHGHFIMVDVEGGYPCSRCMAARDYQLQRQEREFRRLDKQLHDTVHSARSKLKALELNYLADVSSTKSGGGRSAGASLGGGGSGALGSAGSTTPPSPSRRKSSAGSTSSGGSSEGEDGGTSSTGESPTPSTSGGDGEESGSASGSDSDDGSASESDSDE